MMVSPPFNGAIMLRGIFHACWIQAFRAVRRFVSRDAGTESPDLECPTSTPWGHAGSAARVISPRLFAFSMHQHFTIAGHQGHCTDLTAGTADQSVRISRVASNERMRGTRTHRTSAGRHTSHTLPVGFSAESSRTAGHLSRRLYQAAFSLSARPLARSRCTPNQSSRSSEQHAGHEPRAVRPRLSRRRARIAGLQPLPQAQTPVFTRAACMPALPKGSNRVRVRDQAQQARTKARSARECAQETRYTGEDALHAKQERRTDTFHPSKMPWRTWCKDSTKRRGLPAQKPRWARDPRRGLTACSLCWHRSFPSCSLEIQARPSPIPSLPSTTNVAAPMTANPALVVPSPAVTGKRMESGSPSCRPLMLSI